MFPRLLMLGIGLAAGYVLGTRDGRTRIDWLRNKLSPVIDDPRVQRARKDVEDYARKQAPVIRKRAEEAAKAAPGAIADAAQDAAGKVADVAKDVSQRVADTAKDVSEKVTETAKDVRQRGETVVERATRAAGSARDRLLEDDHDDDHK